MNALLRTCRRWKIACPNSISSPNRLISEPRFLYTIFTGSSQTNTSLEHAPSHTITSRNHLLAMKGTTFDQLRFKGHSKWDNIKHTKAKMDNARSVVFSRLAMRIRKCAHKGGPDPKINRALGDIIAEARRHNMPNDTIERNIQRGVDTEAKPVTFEILGPKQCCAIIVEAETDHLPTLKKDIRAVAKKYEAALCNDNMLKNLFTQKGLIIVDKKDKQGKPVSLENVEEIAILCDGEEVRCEPDPDNPEEEVYVIVTDPNILDMAKTQIDQKTHLVVKSAEREFIPHNRIELQEELLEKVGEMIAELDSIAEVQRVFDNVK